MSYLDEEIFSYPWGRFSLVVYLKGEKVEKAYWCAKEVKLKDPKTKLANLVYSWLEKYFLGINAPMQFFLNLPKSEFYQKIYLSLLKIPFGETISYSELAHRVGYPKAARAVGQAMAKNPLPVFIPCHRVVGKNSLGGYTPCIELKEALLSLEMKHEKQKRALGLCLFK